MKKEDKFQPIEKHQTAAWASIAETKPNSNVTIPMDMQVEHAKKHVDSNEK